MTDVASRHATATGYTDSGLASGTTYYYRVRAENAAAYSHVDPDATGARGDGDRAVR